MINQARVGDSHMKGAGMLVGNFEKETNLGVARPFFNP